MKAKFLRTKWVIVLAIFITIVFLSFFYMHSQRWFNPSAVRRAHDTKRYLYHLRNQITSYRDITGEYPDSLAHLQEFITKNPEAGLVSVFVFERISDPNGKTDEYHVLDGKGGWYYDKETGTVRVNLTKPIKAHIKSYVGPIEKEIPSEW